MTQSLRLELADGQLWRIRPADSRAALHVAELGKVMGLVPGSAGRELCVSVCEDPDDPDWLVVGAEGSVVCRIAVPTDHDARAVQVQMQRMGDALGCGALAEGGLLLHAALAEYHGSGFIMAAPSETGKSTASSRLPASWRALCDDETLVVQDRKGRFWAHPWPTWSRFHDGGVGGCWPVEHAVPLRAVFFLSQSPSDHLEPVNGTQASSLILASAVNLRWIARKLSEADPVSALLRGKGVCAAKALASAVPVYSLKLSLDGRFWEKIEQVLPLGALSESGTNGRCQDPESVGSLMARDSLRMVYTGKSMNPTFREPDVLEVKPYGTQRARTGDVVCFKSPGDGATVVHRVVDVRPGGIRTRGDSDRAQDDLWVLQQDDIIGQVVAAQRGTRRRVVRGGNIGPLALHCVRLGQSIRRLAGRLPHVLYEFFAELGPFDRLLPLSLRPRLVRFHVRYWSRLHRPTGLRYRESLKLLMGRQAIGEYDSHLDKWDIRRPLRLFVNEQALRQTVSLVLHSEEQK